MLFVISARPEARVAVSSLIADTCPTHDTHAAAMRRCFMCAMLFVISAALDARDAATSLNAATSACHDRQHRDT